MHGFLENTHAHPIKKVSIKTSISFILFWIISLSKIGSGNQKTRTLIYSDRMPRILSPRLTCENTVVGRGFFKKYFLFKNILK
jgi:hypothetical protein